jgi:hypothetical protein
MFLKSVIKLSFLQLIFEWAKMSLPLEKVAGCLPCIIAGDLVKN